MSNWYDNLKKSPLTPPPIYFSIVWTIIYITIFISLVLVMRNLINEDMVSTIVIFSIKMLLNILWVHVFFTKKNLPLSFIIIILLDIFTFMTIINFYRVNKVAGFLLIPNMLWILFATYLNYYIVMNN